MAKLQCLLSVVVALTSLLSPPPCAAQCLEWKAEIGNGDLSTGRQGEVRTLAVHDDGTGARLFAGGAFDLPGGSPANIVARWDGASWSSIGDFDELPWPLETTVEELCVFDDGIQRVLVATGDFDVASGLPVHHIASWNGTSWSGLGTGLSSRAYALATFDDGNGPALYVGGVFANAGGVSANGIAKWNGASWSALGSGLVPAAGGGSIQALCVFDDGSGPALYAGGQFTGINGVAANNIARFDGVTWSSVGAGVNNGVFCLTVFDDGLGPALYAGGIFTAAGGAPANRIAKWNGVSWSALGSGLGAVVRTLTSWNDGTGSKLVVGGAFGGGIVIWDGAAWRSLRGALRNAPSQTPAAFAALAYDDGLGLGAELFVGGSFTHVDGDAADSIARYGPCTRVGTPYCFGDGSLPTPCPCLPPSAVPSPSGGSDGGCANSFVASGGKLVASGSTNPDTARLLVSDVTPGGFGFFISGDASESSGVASYDGVRCAGGAFVRFGGQYASNRCMRYPNDFAGWSAPLSQVSSVVPGSGSVRHYQLIYRNAAIGFCNPSTLNWTNAVTLIW